MSKTRNPEKKENIMTTRFNINPIVASLLCGCLVGLSSCSDFFEGDSESIIKTDGQVYNSELEARAGLFGLLEGLQQVSDNYVIMGELRADLMTTTQNSSQELHDIAEFNIATDNSYLREREYYALLNDCNYYIQHLDTTVTKLVSGRSQKYLYPYLAQAKAIRAWAYLQLCLDYGSVYYTTEPQLSTLNSQLSTLNLDALLPLLTADLEAALPYAAVGTEDASWAAGLADPGFTSSVNFGDYSASQLMFPLRFVLAECYMWQQNFQQAVQLYYQLIIDNRLRLCQYRNLYNNQGTDVTTRQWTTQFSGFNYQDILTAIVENSDKADTRSHLYQMAYQDYTIAPSGALADIFDAQFYYTNRQISGDLRGLYGTYRLTTAASVSDGTAVAQITKYNSMQASSRRYVAPCRAALLWLRYAECLNRLGKPKMTFNGLLKYGLSAYNINLYRDRPALEGEVTGEPWMDFGQDAPDGELATLTNQTMSRGFHARGCGNTDMNEAYTIEEQSSAADSLLWVENQLIDEYVLETALEGNRFHDLMRWARYRGDNSVLADRIAAKFPAGEQAAIRTKLMDEHNWYLPHAE